MKELKLILVLICFMIFIPIVKAIECPNSDKIELRKLASNVKVSYDEATGIREPGTYGPPDGYTEEDYVSYYDYFEVKFLNVTENIFIKVTNNINEEEKIINYNDTENGEYILNWKDTSKVVSLKYIIYASNKTNCYNYEIKSGVLTLPAYNPYYTHNKCLGLEDYSLCHKYVNFNITYDSFIEKINKHLEEAKKQEEEKDEKENDNFFRKVNLFYKKNKEIVLIFSVGVIIVGGIIIGLTIRKKRGRTI